MWVSFLRGGKVGRDFLKRIDIKKDKKKIQKNTKTRTIY